MFNKPIETVVLVHDLIASRWSGRAYDSTREVSSRDLLALLEAARWSPSCFGEQPWRLLVWDRFKNADTWRRAVACLTESNRQWATSAPLLLLACAKRTFSHNQQINRWSEYDTGAACMAFSLQATALGLMVHQMGGFNGESVRTEFSIPEDYLPMAMLTVGYQVPESQIPDDLRERELSVRKRNTMASMFYADAWGKGIN